MYMVENMNIKTLPQVQVLYVEDVWELSVIAEDCA